MLKFENNFHHVEFKINVHKLTIVKIINIKLEQNLSVTSRPNVCRFCRLLVEGWRWPEDARAVSDETSIPNAYCNSL